MKYQELYKNLVELIGGGEEVQPDGRFMSEREISAKFGVSRSTVRRAIADLCNQGYLVQIHGSGTYVKNRQKTQSLYSVVRCAQNYSEMGLHPSQEILSQEVVEASQAVAEHLQIECGDPVLRLNMLYYADREPLNQTISYLPLNRFPGLEKRNFCRIPLLEILEKNYEALPRRTDNTLEAILPPAHIAQNLRMKPNMPLLLFESVTMGLLSTELLPFEYFKCYYKTDTLRFSFTQNHVLP